MPRLIPGYVLFLITLLILTTSVYAQDDPDVYESPEGYLNGRYLVALYERNETSRMVAGYYMMGLYHATDYVNEQIACRDLSDAELLAKSYQYFKADPERGDQAILKGLLAVCAAE